MYIKDYSKNNPYPGRQIFLYIGENSVFGYYLVMARSEVNKVRDYIYNNDLRTVAVSSTNPELMAEGDLTLLDYSALKHADKALVLSNGRQIDGIRDYYSGRKAESILREDLADWHAEHDKYNTPRITAVAIDEGDRFSVAMQSIRIVDSVEVHDTFDVSDEKNKLLFISTYEGKDVRPTPSFVADPLEFDDKINSLSEGIDLIFNAFEPNEGESDYRVSIVGVELARGEGVKVEILNSSSMI